MHKISAKIQVRIDILTKYLDGRIKRKDAARIIEVSERQFTRIVTNFRRNGLRSLVHGNIGRKPNNRILEEVEERIVYLFRTKYTGFNIRHFWEKLGPEIGHHRPSYSSVRKLLLKHRLHYPRVRKPRKKRQMRPRYESEGVLVQIDGSHHKWFGDAESCLIAAIDDATGKILGAKFSPSETTFDTMDVVKEVLVNYGRFHILYSDKAGIYDNKKREGFSNLTRALYSLDIHTILANSPEGKGRIERLFRTLQDRLISEMRLIKINTIKEANFYLKKFVNEYNQKFAIPAISRETGFRKIEDSNIIDEVFCLYHYRKIMPGSVVSFKNERYLVEDLETFSRTRVQIEIREYHNKNLKFFVNGVQVRVIKIDKYNRAI